MPFPARRYNPPMSSPDPSPAILFVCTGNICRSPAAEGVLRAMAAAEGFQNLAVDSAGVGAWHVGEPPDPRAVHAAKIRGYDIASLVARRARTDDFHNFTRLYGMAAEHLKALEKHAPETATAQILPFPGGDVADPYFGGDEGFAAMMSHVESGCREILNSLRRGKP